MKSFRRFLLFAALAGCLVPTGGASAATFNEIIPQTTAMRHGLTRAWWSQIQLDRSRGRIAHVALHQGTLFVQTDQSVLHALDAETGQTLWAVQVGRRGHPSLEPAANDRLVAVINGSTLYLINRYNGKQLWQRQIDGAPGAGPAISKNRVYVPMVDGMVASYQLDPMVNPLEELSKIPGHELSAEERAALDVELIATMRINQDYRLPLFCQSAGRALVQPIVTRQLEDEEYVAWPTDRGYLCVGVLNADQGRFNVRYRLETAAGIAARPTYMPPNAQIVSDSGVIYAASRDGFVHAIRERGGEALWQFSTGEPIIQPAVVVGSRIYITPQTGGMYCLDARTGREIWWTPRVYQFVAASKNRIYATDQFDRVLILDARSGVQIDAAPATGLTIRLTNTVNDRLYVGSKTGIIQCLHEIELTEPFMHAAELAAAPPQPTAVGPATSRLTPAATPAPAAPAAPAAPKPVPTEDPFGSGGDDPFGSGGDDPFGSGGDDPFGSGGDDPFGGGGSDDPFG